MKGLLIGGLGNSSRIKGMSPLVKSMKYVSVKSKNLGVIQNPSVKSTGMKGIRGIQNTSIKYPSLKGNPSIKYPSMKDYKRNTECFY